MSEIQNTRQDGLAEVDDENGMSISELLGVLREHLKLLTIAPPTTQPTSTTEEAMALNSANAANSRLIEPLCSLKPIMPIVLQMTPLSDAPPEMVLEVGDCLSSPARSTTVGVFGSVFSTGSDPHSPSHTVGDYLRPARSLTRCADDNSEFLMWANRSVSSSLQVSGVFSRGTQFAGLVTAPGETIFLPEEPNKVTWVQKASDWTQILYPLGIGIAGIKSEVS